MKKDKWEKFGGGGSRSIQFTKGNGDFPILKPSGKTLNISIGPGLPPDSSNLNFSHSLASMTISPSRFPLRFLEAIFRQHLSTGSICGCLVSFPLCSHLSFHFFYFPCVLFTSKRFIYNIRDLEWTSPRLEVKLFKTTHFPSYDNVLATLYSVIAIT